MLLRKKSQLVQTIAPRTARIISVLMIFFMGKGEGRTVSASGRRRLKSHGGSCFPRTAASGSGKEFVSQRPSLRRTGARNAFPYTGGAVDATLEKERGKSEKNRPGVDVTDSLIHFSHRRAKAGIPAASCAIPFLRLRSGKGRCAERNSRTDLATRGYPI